MLKQQLRHPFFKPVYRRVLVTALCFGWGLFEGYNGAMGWAAVFIGLALYCGYEFFWNWQDPDGPDQQDPKP